MNTDNPRRHFVIRTILSLRIELLCFIAAYTGTSRILGYQQLVQDKICLQTYNQSIDYCRGLSYADSSDIKNGILADSTVFLTEKELIGIVPNVVGGIYAGAWCDSFRYGRKAVVLLGLLGYFLESTSMALNAYFFEWPLMYLLLVSLPTNMMGNGFWIAALSYLTVTTEQEDRSIRFILLDAITISGVGLGFYLGAWFLSNEHPFMRSGLHNYADNMAFSSIILLLGIVYAFLAVRNVFEKKEDVHNEGTSTDPLLSDTSTSTENVSISPETRHRTNILRQIFTPSHLTQTFKALTVKRPNNFHKTFWWILLFLVMQTLPYLGANNIVYPLTERLYNWDYIKYSNFSIMSTLVKPLGSLIIMPIFKILKVNDVQVSLVGVIFNIFSCNSLASIVSPLGFYLYIGFGCLANIGSIGVRSFITLFLPESEISRIFSLILTLEVLQPFIGSFFYSSILKLTIKDYPTFSFHMTTGLLIFALCIICTIDLFWAEAIRNKKESNRKMLVN